MKVAPNFDIREFVPPVIYKKYGGKASKWFVNPKLFALAQGVKEYLTEHYKEEDPDVKTVTVVINNWHYAKSAIRRWSGLRTFQYIKQQLAKGTKTATLSQHIGGQCNAIDFKAYIVYTAKSKKKKKTIPSNDIRKLILKNEAHFMSFGLTTLEDGRIAPTWVHMDCRNTGLSHIFVFGKR